MAGNVLDKFETIEDPARTQMRVFRRMEHTKYSCALRTVATNSVRLRLPQSYCMCRSPYNFMLLCLVRVDVGIQLQNIYTFSFKLYIWVVSLQYGAQQDTENK